MSKSSGQLMMKNTTFLYIRMFVIMCINLIAVRLLLRCLGQTDYGIYNVVGGVVTMLSFMSTSMSSAAQRFYAYEIGKHNTEGLNRVFIVSIICFVAIGLMCVFFADTVGLWLVNTKLSIPPDRAYAAQWVYQCSIFSFTINMIAVPFIALVIASERMNFYAIVSICDAVVKLLIIYILTIVNGDKLIVYASLFALISIVNFLAYFIYCKKKYRQIRFYWVWDKSLCRQLFSYCGWYMFGSLSVVIRSQGINILLNIFFSPIVNAARAVAYQVNAAVNMFVTSFYQAVRPQIIKRYAANDIDSMLSLVLKSTKLSYYLVLLISVPLLIEAPYLLHLWLGDVPEYTVIFTRLVIIVSMIDTLGNPLTTAVCAKGQIKWFQIITGSIVILNLPISYVFLKLGYEPQITMIIAICIAVVSQAVRVLFTNKTFGMNVWQYTLLIVKILVITCLAFALSMAIKYLLPAETTSMVLLRICLMVILTFVVVVFVGVNSQERKMFRDLVSRKKDEKE